MEDYLSYPTTIRDSVQLIVFQHVCSTCLAKDRDLCRLDDQLRILMNTLGIKMTNLQKVCWECCAMIKNIFRFKHTAAKAQNILLRRDWKAMNVVGSTSRLGIAKSIKMLSIFPTDQQSTTTPLPVSPTETVIISPSNPPALQPIGSGKQNNNPQWVQFTTVVSKRPAKKLPALQPAKFARKLPSLQPLFRSASPDTRYLITMERFIKPCDSSFDHTKVRPIGHVTHDPHIILNQKVPTKRTIPTKHNPHTQSETDETPALRETLLYKSVIEIENRDVTKTGGQVIPVEIPIPNKSPNVVVRKQGYDGKKTIEQQGNYDIKAIEQLENNDKKTVSQKENSVKLKIDQDILTEPLPETHSDDNYTDNNHITLQKLEKIPKNFILLDDNKEKIDKQNSNTDIITENLETLPVAKEDYNNTDNNPATLQCLEKTSDSKRSHKKSMEKQSAVTFIPTENIKTLCETHGDRSNTDSSCEKSLDKNLEQIEKQSTNTFNPTENKESLFETYGDDNKTDNDPATLQSLLELLESDESLEENEEHIEKQNTQALLELLKSDDSLDGNNEEFEKHNTKYGHVQTENLRSLPERQSEDNNTDNGPANLEELPKSKESLDENKINIEKQSANTDIQLNKLEILPQMQGDKNKTYNNRANLQYIEELSVCEKSLDGNEKEIGKKGANIDILTENRVSLLEKHGDENYTDYGPATLHSLEELTNSNESLDENKKTIENDIVNTDIPINNLGILLQIYGNNYNTDNNRANLQCTEELPKGEKSLDRNEEEIGKQSTNTDIPTENRESVPETHGDNNNTDNGQDTLHSLEELKESNESLKENKKVIEKQSENTDISTIYFEILPLTYGDNYYTDIDDGANLQYLEKLLESEKSLVGNEEEIGKQSTDADIPTQNSESLPETHGVDNNIDNDPATLHSLHKLSESKESLDENKKDMEKQSANTNITTNYLDILPRVHVDNYNNCVNLQSTEELPKGEKSLDGNKEEIGKQSKNTDIVTDNRESVHETHGDNNNADNGPATLHSFEELKESNESLDENNKNIEKQSVNVNNSTNYVEILPQIHGDNYNTANNRANLQYSEELLESEKSLDENEENIGKQSTDTDIPIQNRESVPETHGDDNNTDNGPVTLHSLEELKESNESLNENKKDIEKQSVHTDILRNYFEIMPHIHGNYYNTVDNRANLQYSEELLESEKLEDGNEEVIGKQITNTDIPTQNSESLPEMHGDVNNIDNGHATLHILHELPESKEWINENKKDKEKQNANTKLKTIPIDIPTNNLEILAQIHDDNYNNHPNLQSTKELPEGEKSLDGNGEESGKHCSNTDISTENEENRPEIHADDNNTDNYPASLHCIEDFLESDELPDESNQEIENQNTNTYIPIEYSDCYTGVVTETLPYSLKFNTAQTELKEPTQEHQTAGTVVQTVGCSYKITTKRVIKHAMDLNSPKSKIVNNDINHYNLPALITQPCWFSTDCPSLTICDQNNTNPIKDTQQKNDHQNTVEQPGNDDKNTVELQCKKEKKKIKTTDFLFARVIDKTSTNKTYSTKNNDNIKTDSKLQPQNNKEKQQLIVRRITAEEPSSLTFNDNQILKLISVDQNNFEQNIPYTYISKTEPIKPFIIDLSEVLKVVLKDHNYSKSVYTKYNKMNRIPSQTKRRRQVQQRNEENGTKRMRLKKDVNNKACDSFIQANLIREIIDNFESEANASDDWDTNKTDDSEVKKNANAKAKFWEHKRRLDASTSCDPLQELFSFDKHRDNLREKVVNNYDIDVEVDVENLEYPQEDINPMLVTVKVEQCSSGSVGSYDDFDENNDWTVESFKATEAIHKGCNSMTDTASETKSNTTKHRNFNAKETLHKGYDSTTDTASETESDITKHRDVSFRSEHSEQSYEDFLNKPLEYHYEDSPSENAKYTYDCLTNVDTNNQAPDEFEMNNLTICFSNSLFDFGSDNMTIEPTLQNTDDPKNVETNYNSQFDEIRNSSPNLLEPLYYTNWKDQTYDHVMGSNQEYSKNIRKQESEQRKEIIKIESCKDQFINSSIKNRRTKRKYDETQKKDTLNNKLRLRSSKRLKKEPPDNKDSTLELKKKTSKSTKPTPAKKKSVPGNEKLSLHIVELTPQNKKTGPANEESLLHNVKSTPENKKSVPNNEESLLNYVKLTTKNKKTVPENEESLLQNVKQIPENKKPVPEKIESLLHYLELTTKNKKPVPENEESLLHNVKPTPENKKTVPENKESLLNYVELTTINKKTVPENEESLLHNVKPTPENKKTVPENKESLLNYVELTTINKKTVPENEESLLNYLELTTINKKTVPENEESLLNYLELTTINKKTVPENEESLLNYVEPTSLSVDSENKDSLLEGINYEKLLLYPVICMEELREVPVQHKIRVKDIFVLNGYDESNTKDPDFSKIISDVAADDLTEINEAILASEINIKVAASVSEDEIHGDHPISNSSMPASDQLEITNENTKIKQRRISTKKFKSTIENLKMCSLRTLEEGEIEKFRKKLKEENLFKGSKYKCLACVRIFCSQIILAAHIKRFHEEAAGSFVCDVCECRFTSEMSLSSHTNTHESCFKCQFCSEEYLYFQHLSTHIKRKHPKTFNDLKVQQLKKSGPKCQICSREFSHDTFLRRHIKRMHPTTSDVVQEQQPTKADIKCQFCSKEFLYSKYLRNHVKRMHPTTSDNVQEQLPKQPCFRCQFCSIEFLDIQNLIKHINWMHPTISDEARKHQEKNTDTKCQFDSKEFLCSKYLRNHIVRMHPTTFDNMQEQPEVKTLFTCTMCGGQYSCRKTIRKHQLNTQLGIACKIRKGNTKYNLSFTGNNINLTDNNLSLMFNNLSFTENNSLTENNLSQTGKYLIQPGNYLSFTENILSTTEPNLVITENDVSLTGNSLSLIENNLSFTENNSLTENNITRTITENNSLTGNNLSLTENQLSTTENFSFTENNVSLAENNVGLTEINLIITENHVSLSENNLSSTENKLSLTGNENTCLDCNKTFRTSFAYKKHMASVHTSREYK